MVANYTASKKPKRKDDFTPGEYNDKRPDRALIVYANVIKKYFKNTKPLVLGGHGKADRLARRRSRHLPLALAVSRTIRRGGKPRK